MEVVSQSKGREKRIQLIGDVNNLGVLNLEKEMEDVEKWSQIAIDLTKVSFVSTSFIAYLLDFKKEHPVQFAKIKLQNPNELTINLLEMSQLNGLIPIEQIK